MPGGGLQPQAHRSYSWAKASKLTCRELVGGEGAEFDMSPDIQNTPSRPSPLPSLHNCICLLLFELLRPPTKSLSHPDAILLLPEKNMRLVTSRYFFRPLCRHTAWAPQASPLGLPVLPARLHAALIWSHTPSCAVSPSFAQNARSSPSCQLLEE